MHDVEQFRAHLVQKGVDGAPMIDDAEKICMFGSRTVNKCLTLLSMMFNYAVAHVWITSNPAAAVAKLKADNHDEEGNLEGVVLESEEVQDLLEAADDG